MDHEKELILYLTSLGESNLACIFWILCLLANINEWFFFCCYNGALSIVSINGAWKSYKLCITFVWGWWTWNAFSTHNLRFISVLHWRKNSWLSAQGLCLALGSHQISTWLAAYLDLIVLQNLGFTWYDVKIKFWNYIILLFKLEDSSHKPYKEPYEILQLTL